MSLARNVLLFAMFAALSSLASAQQINEDAEGGVFDQPYLPLLETLIDHVGEGRIDDALTILENDTSKGVPEQSRDSLKRTLANIYGGGGKYEGHEMVALEMVSARLHRAYAIAYHERQPVIYTFTMYQFDGEWKMHHVNWNDNIAELAEIVNRQRR